MPGMRSLPVKTVPSRRSISALPAEGRPGPSDDDDDDDDGRVEMIRWADPTLSLPSGRGSH